MIPAIMTAAGLGLIAMGAILLLGEWCCSEPESADTVSRTAE